MLGPYNLTAWFINEDEEALEAWERMTFGGVNGVGAVAYDRWTNWRLEHTCF